jgi:hypothetical protein
MFWNTLHLSAKPWHSSWIFQNVPLITHMHDWPAMMSLQAYQIWGCGEGGHQFSHCAAGSWPYLIKCVNFEGLHYAVFSSLCRFISHKSRHSPKHPVFMHPLFVRFYILMTAFVKLSSGLLHCVGYTVQQPSRQPSSLYVCVLHLTWETRFHTSTKQEVKSVVLCVLILTSLDSRQKNKDSGLPGR